jgi:hypothetical protein
MTLAEIAYIAGFLVALPVATYYLNKLGMKFQVWQQKRMLSKMTDKEKEAYEKELELPQNKDLAWAKEIVKDNLQVSTAKKVKAKA